MKSLSWLVLLGQTSRYMIYEVRVIFVYINCDLFEKHLKQHKNVEWESILNVFFAFFFYCCWRWQHTTIALFSHSLSTVLTSQFLMLVRSVFGTLLLLFFCGIYNFSGILEHFNGHFSLTLNRPNRRWTDEIVV